MNMKVARKFGENDQYLEDIIIHQKSKTNLNTTVIKAKTGQLISSEESDIIQLVLNDGHYYEEIQKKSAKDNKKHPFNKSEFETYIKNIDISSLGTKDIEAESDITTNKMKNIARLSEDIDSLKSNNLKLVKAFSKSIYSRLGAFAIEKTDSLKTKEKVVTPKLNEGKALDTIKTIDGILTAIPEWQRTQLFNNAKSNVSNILSTIKSKKKELGKRYDNYYRHILSYHKKFALALSCIILFFVAAPLGAIIRKGGLGLPMVIAIILFLVYYFIGVFAENYAKKGEIHPVLGAWLSTLIMLPLSIFLTKRASADRGLTSFGNITDVIKGWFKKKEKLT